MREPGSIEGELLTAEPKREPEPPKEEVRKPEAGKKQAESYAHRPALAGQTQEGRPR